MNRLVINALKKELSELWNTKDEAVNELKRYRKTFPSELDYNIYAHGNIRPYYSQIEAFFKSVPYDIGDVDNDTLELIFKRYVRIATDELLKEEGVM